MYTLHAIHDSLDNIPPAKQHQYKQYHTVPYHAKLPYQLTICLKISRILAVLTFSCMGPSLFRGTFCKNRTGTGRMVPQTVDIHIYCLSVWKLVFFLHVFWHLPILTSDWFFFLYILPKFHDEVMHRSHVPRPVWRRGREQWRRWMKKIWRRMHLYINLYCMVCQYYAWTGAGVWILRLL